MKKERRAEDRRQENRRKEEYPVQISHRNGERRYKERRH
jgi:hypothetical protein